MSEQIDSVVRELADKQAVAETHYRYAAALDRKDLEGLKACFTADAVAAYGNNGEVSGPDEIVAWIDNDIHVYARQHHLLTQYHASIDGDSAQALVYHTSHQVRHDDPDAVQVLVCRYHTDLRREADEWRISRLVFEVIWAERREDHSGRLAEFGGAGPSATDLHFGGWGPAVH